MAIIDLFSKENYPQLRSYTLLLAALIAGGGVLVNISGNKSNGQDAVSNQNDGSQIASVYWLHSTDNLWENSGIEVKKGDKISITISGSYYESIDSIRNGTNQPLSLNASGKKESASFNKKDENLIASDASYGQLLCQIVKKRYKADIRPEKQLLLPLNDGYNSFKADRNGVLWFTTNHPAFYPYKQQANILYETTFNKSVSALNLSNNRPEPFYEDNFGQLLIQVSIE